MAGAYSLGVRIAIPHLGYNLDDWAWGILCIGVMLPVLAIELDYLREVYLRAERILDVTVIEHVSIRR